MDWIVDHQMRLLFLLAYMALLSYHCWLANRGNRNLEDYLVAGRGLGGWIVALSSYATFVSTNTFIGQAGKSWDVGIIWYCKALVFGVLCYLSWHFVAPRFVTRTREYGSLTVADFLGHRFQSRAVRRLTSGVIVVASVLYLVAVYKGSAIALQEFLGMGYSTAVLAIFGVVTVYTLAGGFRSVVMTDAVQGLFMFAGAIALIIVVINAGGGLTAILDTLRTTDPELVSWRGKLPLLSIFGLAFAGGVKLLVEPRQLSRLYGLRDDQALRTARVVAPLLIIITYLCVLPIGALARAVIPAQAINDSDLVIPYLLGTSQILGPILSSFFLLVLLSAAMSSLDSVLLVAGSTISRDLFDHPDQDIQGIRLARIWVFVVSLVSMLLALNPIGDIVEVTAFSGSMYAACFLPTLVLGLYWQRGTAAGAISCLVIGSTVSIGWYCARKAGWTELHEVYPSLLLALTAYIVISLLTLQRSESAGLPR
ncbi:MAG: hypothetical protein CMJ59_01175 [Planctomycetaceae bacterium]|nr:hypothetical protein [Planctomycetaceae bacterium]